MRTDEHYLTSNEIEKMICNTGISKEVASKIYQVGERAWRAIVVRSRTVSDLNLLKRALAKTGGGQDEND